MGAGKRRAIAVAVAAGLVVLGAGLHRGAGSPADEAQPPEIEAARRVNESSPSSREDARDEALAPAPASSPSPEPIPLEEEPPPPDPPEGRRLVLRGRDAPEEPLPPFADGSGREAVRAALREVTPGMRDCYQQGLRLEPELQGNLVLELSLEARDGVGRIIEATIDEEASTMRALFVQACVLKELSGARFPAPRGDGAIAIRYPFHFAPP